MKLKNTISNTVAPISNIERYKLYHGYAIDKKKSQDKPDKQSKFVFRVVEVALSTRDRIDWTTDEMSDWTFYETSRPMV